MGKTGVKGYVADPKDLYDRLEQCAVDAFSKWQRSYVIPATRFRAPVYSGVDPRENFHPRGLLARYIGSVTAVTKEGKSYITCGIPGATGAGAISDPDRAWIITQVLHRGWVAPKARLKPMVFPVPRTELRNPDLEIPPPAGTPEDPSVAWIYITYARPQSHLTLNLFHVKAFEGQFPQFMNIFTDQISRAGIPGRCKKNNYSFMR